MLQSFLCLLWSIHIYYRNSLIECYAWYSCSFYSYSSKFSYFLIILILDYIKYSNISVYHSVCILSILWADGIHVGSQWSIWKLPNRTQCSFCCESSDKLRFRCWVLQPYRHELYGINRKKRIKSKKSPKWNGKFRPRWNHFY